MSIVKAIDTVIIDGPEKIKDYLNSSVNTL